MKDKHHNHIGLQRRCNVCTNTYIYKSVLTPEEAEEQSKYVEQTNKVLVCSLFCYLKLIGKFICRLTGTSFAHQQIQSSYVCNGAFWHGLPEDEASNWNLAYTKQDQQHYQ